MGRTTGLMPVDLGELLGGEHATFAQRIMEIDMLLRSIGVHLLRAGTISDVWRETHAQIWGHEVAHVTGLLGALVIPEDLLVQFTAPESPIRRYRSGTYDMMCVDAVEVEAGSRVTLLDMGLLDDVRDRPLTPLRMSHNHRRTMYHMQPIGDDNGRLLGRMSVPDLALTLCNDGAGSDDQSLKSLQVVVKA